MTFSNSWHWYIMPKSGAKIPPTTLAKKGVEKLSESALEGVKVLDLTHHIAGPYCTKLLAGFGAEVIKVERPGTGDPARQAGPFPGDVPHLEKSGLFLHLNTNKQSVTLNLQHPSGQALVRALVKQVDVVVENFSP